MLEPVRVMSQPAYPASRPARVVAARLAEACRHPLHAFWAEDVSLLEPGLIEWSGILAHRQVTEAYLLALAVCHGGRLAAFDRRIAVEVVPGARAESLVIIA